MPFLTTALPDKPTNFGMLRKSRPRRGGRCVVGTCPVNWTAGELLVDVSIAGLWAGVSWAHLLINGTQPVPDAIELASERDDRAALSPGQRLCAARGAPVVV